MCMEDGARVTWLRGVTFSVVQSVSVTFSVGQSVRTVGIRGWKSLPKKLFDTIVPNDFARSSTVRVREQIDRHGDSDQIFMVAVQ